MTIPRHTWYPVAGSEEVGRTPLGRRVLGVPVVLYRSTTGSPIALEDRCAHRPVRLSDGRLEDDVLYSGYSGFGYDTDGRCVSVPTQEHVPYGAAVRSFPVRDDGSFVWVWVGEPGLADLRPPPDTDLLRADGWRSFGGTLDVAAGIGLLHDNFCDITHVAHLDSAIAPPVLSAGPTPPLKVEVSERTVRFERRFSPARLASWHAQVLDLPESSEHPQVEEGRFAAPGFWMDRWTVEVTGHGDRDGAHQFVFHHALVPVSETRTRHTWRVSRNFARGAAADGTLAPLFTAYYERCAAVLAQMQQILDEEGPRPEVAVASDAAVSHVRRIMQRLAAEEG